MRIKNRKLEKLRRQKMNTASRKAKMFKDGDIITMDGEEEMTMEDETSPAKSQKGKNSYRVRKNMAKGLPDDEGKNTKVTLELLQKLHYKDIGQSLPDDFKPETYITDHEDSEKEDDSVFDYFFPGSKTKKPKNVKGDNYSEKIFNIKKEAQNSKYLNPIKGNHDVIFEDETQYKSGTESRKVPKSHRSIQPSNPGQSFKSHRRAESQVSLHSKGTKALIK
jgi:hypothetical protein